MVGVRELGAGVPEAVRETLGMSSRAKPVWMKALALALFVFCLDFATKTLAAGSFDLGVKDNLFFVSILHMQNPGVSLGLFSHFGLIGGNGVQIPIYVYVVALVIGTNGLLKVIARAPHLWLPIGILLGGVFGNVLELLYHGYATDFIYIPSVGGTANLADFALTFGLVSLIVVDLGWLLVNQGRKYRAAIAAGALS